VRARIDDHAPAVVVAPEAVVDVLFVGAEQFIEISDVLDTRPTQEEAGTRRPVALDDLVGCGRRYLPRTPPFPDSAGSRMGRDQGRCDHACLRVTAGDSE